MPYIAYISQIAGLQLAAEEKLRNGFLQLVESLFLEYRHRHNARLFKKGTQLNFVEVRR
ncbi:hypothetical protein D3C80_1892890 [compost metagenome]